MCKGRKYAKEGGDDLVELTYKTIADLIIVIADMKFDYDNNSINDLLDYLNKEKENTITFNVLSFNQHNRKE